LDRALVRRGSLLLVGGEPGIGKSRLIDEFAKECRERGMQVARGRCWEGKGAQAFWPWVQLLRSCFATTPRCSWPGARCYTATSATPGGFDEACRLYESAGMPAWAERAAVHGAAIRAR
jgi:hypothetical protein